MSQIKHRDNFIRETNKSSFELFSFKVGGYAVGVFMPWVILSVLVFILGYVVNIKNFARKHDIEKVLSPTLLTEKGYVSTPIVFLTLVLLPVATQLSISLNLELPSSNSGIKLGASIATVILGFLIMFQARRIINLNQHSLLDKLFKGR